MLNFIICDDENYIKERIIKIISRVMMPIDIEYKTHSFSSYDEKFEQIIDKKMGNKLYVLDIEVNNKSGLDIARRIREKDWRSIIIILSVHYELIYDAFKERLMLLDFISKFDNYEKNLYDSIKTALEIFDSSSKLCFDYKGVLYKIDLKDILYITKEELSRKIKIKTFNKEYSIGFSLKEILKRLDNRFCKTHRACIINKENVKKIDYKQNNIYFSDGSNITLLSKKYKKEVKNNVFS